VSDIAASNNVGSTASAETSPTAGSLRRRQLLQATAVSDPSSSGAAADADSSTAAAAAGDSATTLQHSNDTLSIGQAYTTLVDGAFLLSAAQSVMLGGSSNAAGSAGVCVAPALIPQKLAGGFKVMFDCRGVSASAEVSISYMTVGCDVLLSFDALKRVPAGRVYRCSWLREGVCVCGASADSPKAG
jgi:hypothetical protein